MTVLITGGSGCGKSHYAERLISRLGAYKRLCQATESVTRVVCGIGVRIK